MSELNSSFTDEDQGQTSPPDALLDVVEKAADKHIADQLAAQSNEAKAQAKEAPVVDKKVWTRAQVVRSVKCPVILPALYPDVDPWVFDMRLKLSVDAEERRAVYLALSPSEQTVKEQEQNLDEVCDLLNTMPTGFGDLKENGMGPGPSFKDYVMSSDEATKQTLFTIVRGAINLYQRKTSPHEFLGKV